MKTDSNSDFSSIKPIGTIHSPYTNLADMPIQPKGAAETEGRVEIFDEYAGGLADLEGFSHIYLIYLFHKATRTELSVIPFMDTVRRGVYSTRSPLRPNHLGLSLVQMTSVQNNFLNILGVDILDNTPLIDIKPYIPAFDHVENAESGWMNHSEEDVARKKSDHRFI